MPDSKNAIYVSLCEDVLVRAKKFVVGVVILSWDHMMLEFESESLCTENTG